jgi:hypothetical protein
MLHPVSVVKNIVRSRGVLPRPAPDHASYRSCAAFSDPDGKRTGPSDMLRTQWRSRPAKNCRYETSKT